jgi:hypothetical protein
MLGGVIQGPSSLNIEGDFTCVRCITDTCINRGFISTVEKRTGMVISTNAMYRPPNAEEYDKAKDEKRIPEWTPQWPHYRDIPKP